MSGNIIPGSDEIDYQGDSGEGKTAILIHRVVV